jgi:hypothetical protein
VAQYPEAAGESDEYQHEVRIRQYRCEISRIDSSGQTGANTLSVGGAVSRNAGVAPAPESCVCSRAAAAVARFEKWQDLEKGLGKEDYEKGPGKRLVNVRRGC